MIINYTDLAETIQEYYGCCERIAASTGQIDYERVELQNLRNDIVGQIQSGLFNGVSVNTHEVKLTNGAGDFDLKVSGKEIGIELPNQYEPEGEPVMLWIGHNYTRSS